MEKVTILRRRELLDSTETTLSLKKDHMVVTSTDQLGPDPQKVPRQIQILDLRPQVTRKCDMYARFSLAVSSAPSSLPLPSFSKKKQVLVDDSTTRDLNQLDF
ncbi:conserved hypothetical protein [Ricinus communis]|uniref:Uncharacterized protein n=1 Tax=Ricinus communis TaxID=3988 RepID=B9T0S5_RICCO|nr:conserved hypothetical protein [Ricinus communis]